MIKKAVTALCVLFAAVSISLILSANTHAAGAVPITQTYFPDSNFRSWVSKNCDTDKDGILSEAEANIWGEIHVESMNIASLKGIEYFPSLIVLHCSGNKLTGLDLSRNTNMFYVDCSWNRISKLQLTNNPLLETLYCSGNRLTSLEFPSSPNLKTLTCIRNQIVKINLSSCPNLEALQCWDNPSLTELNLTYNTKLKELNCAKCSLSFLDLSSSPALTYLDCSLNPIAELNLTHCTALETLYCMSMELTSLNISNCTALKGANCGGNKISAIDLSKNKALEWFSCGSNQLKSIDCSNNTKLTFLGCSVNPITDLNISKNTALEDLYCENNRLSSLDCSKNTMLKGLDCSNNKLSSLDLSKNGNLESLYCSNNRLTVLDVSKNPMLYRLRCENNRLKTLKIQKNDELGDLRCEGNSLSSVDVSQCPSLQDRFRYNTSEIIGSIVYIGRYLSGEEYDWHVSYDSSTSFIAFPAPSLSASVSSSQVKLKWKSIEGAEQYEVYRKAGSGAFKRIKNVGTTSFTDKNAPGGYITYSVRAKSGYLYSEFDTVTVAINPFTDVSESDSYFSSVMWAVGNGIVSGTTSTTFSPKSPCTRYQFAVMLYRLAGKPAVSSVTLPFTDVPSDASYYSAVAWAYSSKIISGTSSTTFSPNNTVTRYQAVAMLYKMARKPAVSGTNPFTDVPSDASYYKAVLWAVQKGITKGTSATAFSPMADCQRYQMAAFLNRFNSVYHYK